MKITHIGSVELTYPLWWDDYNKSDTFFSSTETTITGGTLVWNTIKANSGKSVTLNSRDDAWQKTSVKDAIIDLANTTDTTTTITLSDGSVLNVRFKHELDGGSVVFERLFDANLVDYYKCKIYLARV